MSKFDVEKFTVQICTDIYNIHRVERYERENKRYNEWIHNNIDDLNELYMVSGLEWEFNLFCSYVYNNTLKTYY